MQRESQEMLTRTWVNLELLC